MPSTYSSSLRLELQATGENANTWGTKTNNNLNLIEQAVTGYTKLTLVSASSTYTLPIADASASNGRNAFIEFAGTVASAISVVVPDVNKGYWVKNSATGSPLTFRTSSGTGTVLPTNQWVFLISDGASITSTFPTSIAGVALLNATQVFTGANTFASAMTLTGPVSVSASAVFTRPVDILSTLSVTGSAVFTGAVTLSSAVAINAPLSVTGAAVFTSTVNISNSLVVAATIESTLGGMKFPDGTLQNTAAAGATVPDYLTLNAGVI